MADIVIISKSRESVFEFKVNIEGIDTSDIKVNFNLEADGIDLKFQASVVNDDIWSVKIPPLEFLNETLYPFFIEVIVDGYYFKTMEGSANIISDHKVTTSTPVNVSIKPPKPVDKKVEIKSTKKDPEIDKNSGPKDTVELKKIISDPITSKTTKEPIKTKKDSTTTSKFKLDIKPEPLKISGKSPSKKTMNTEIDDKIVDLMKRAKKNSDDNIDKSIDNSTETAKKNTDSIIDSTDKMNPDKDNKNNISDTKDETKLNIVDEPKNKSTSKKDKTSKPRKYTKKTKTKPKNDTTKPVGKSDVVNNTVNSTQKTTDIKEKVSSMINDTLGRKNSNIPKAMPSKKPLDKSKIHTIVNEVMSTPKTNKIDPSIIKKIDDNEGSKIDNEIDNKVSKILSEDNINNEDDTHNKTQFKKLD